MIWCVEDDASIRDIEVYALTSTGFEAKGFEDGDSFWNALQTEKPRLLDPLISNSNQHHLIGKVILNPYIIGLNDVRGVRNIFP